jgi:DNA-binding response OmpR family regulator
LKVLIAEDDPFFRRLLQKLLASECEVSTAEDGDAAWTLLQRSDGPVLAILDWVMPGMAGPQLCREVRANPATAGIYLILLTARNSAADILAGMRAGADDFVTKPFEPEELRVRVRLGRKVLELRQSIRAHEIALADALARERVLQARLTALEQTIRAGSIPKSATA